MKTIFTTSRLFRNLLFHLPLLGILLILAYINLLDSQVLEQVRDEQSFALMLVVWIPLGILLGIIQLYIWAKWCIRRASPFSGKIVKMGFMILFAIFVFFVALRYLC